MRRITIVLGLLLAGIATMSAADDRIPTFDQRPVIEVESNGVYKAVYDIHSDATTAGVSRGLYYARGLIEAFGKQGVSPQQLNIHLVVHGDAARFLLIDSTYQTAVNDDFAVNMNANLVQALTGLGVKVEICRSAMKSAGWTADDVLPDVTIIHDGYTRLVKLQNDGYAYIGGF